MKPNTSFYCLMAFASVLFTTVTATASQTLTGHVPEAITQGHLPPIGRLAGTNRLHLVLELPLRNREALTQFLGQLYDPASPHYHKYLTREEFTEQFGPTTNEYQAVTAFAQQHGLAPGPAHSSRLMVDVQGNVADIESAFHVILRTYQHPTEARTFYAPDAEPTVDTDLPLLEIGGLSDYPQARRLARAHQVTGTAGTAAGSGYGGLYVSKDLRNAYLPGSSLAGSGQMVGLFAIDGFYASDIQLYEKFAGLTNVPVQTVLIDGFNGTPAIGQNLEVELDIEMAIAMAPALAGVVVFESPNSYADALDIIDSMANNTQISQFSSSIGFTGASPYNYLDSGLMKLAAQGQSFFMAAGDGDAWTQTIWVPAASPYATSVGGTTLTMTGSGAAYASETVWNSGTTYGSWSENNSPDYGSGGGVSSYYTIPTWQTNINMTTNLGSTTMRNIPDVAMVAINCSIVYNNGVTNSFAIGTSVAAPLWAGFTALINQQAAASHKLPIGSVNAAMYSLLQQTNYATAFHDITSGNNYSANSTAKYPATPGYDLCTGLGTPHGTNLINALVATLTSETAPTITVQPASQTVVAGASASFNVTATGTAPYTYYWLRGSTFMTGQTNASFTTNNVQAAASGTQFSCVVSNVIGSVTSQVATLTIQVPPTILTSSPTNQTVVAGGSASFTVTVTGSAPLGYYWMCNGAPIAGANEATYVTNDVPATESGAEFSCLVSNGVGTATSQTATLTVNSPPSITAQPASVTVAAGSTASFAVTAIGTAPLTYFWLSNSIFMAGQTNATFSTGIVQLANSGQQLSCIVSNPAGSVTSSVATLTVELPPGILASSPTNKTVAAGSSATFAVTATGSAPLGYYWMCNGAVIPGANSAAYTTNKVQAGESGAQFTCLVSNTVGMATSQAAILTVDIPPTITAQPASETVAVGTTASFAVIATGTAPLSYFWLSNSIFMAGQTNAAFITNNVQLANSGQQFSCIISNAVGSVTSSVAVLTVELPPSFAAQPTSVTVANGASATFGVTASGTAPLGYYWMCNGMVIPGANSAIYTTNNVPVAESGAEFSCLVSNTVGMATSQVATLTVDLPPGITTQPASETVAVGATANFAVAATGTAPLSYFWLSNSIFMAGQTNAAFITNNVQLANSGQQFSCIISNAVGSVTSSVAVLTVELPPSFAAQPNNVTVANGASATFAVTASGTVPLGYYWMCNGAIIPGANSATYVTNAVLLGESGAQFSCLVSNTVGMATSQAAILTVDIPPTITAQPASETVAVGTTASFAVIASGTAPLSYFWLSNSIFMAGQTNASFTTNSVQLANSGQQFSCIISNAVGSVTSSVATLTVELPPNLTLQPADETVAAGATANFSVTAGGTSVEYFWLLDGTFLPDQTNAALAINNVQLVNTGEQFSCVISNAVGSVTSEVATLTVDVPPGIVAQPANQTVGVGGTAIFSVTATGTPLAYFWEGNSIFIPGATNASFTTNNLQLANSGQQFTCLISNAVGSVTSQVATLTVAVSQAQSPAFSINVAGADLIINGLNGVAGGTYLLLMSTDLTQPVGQWTPVATNVLDASGSFTLTATNAVSPNAPEQFYLLQVH